MIGRWREFLGDAGAVSDESGRILHFGDPARELRSTTTGSIIVDLSHFGLIRASGPDTAKFLQGQLTNDVSKLDQRHSQISGYCTPKGRLLTVLRLFQRGDVFYLQLPRSLLPPTLERLKKYVLMAKVTLADGSDDLVGIGLSGRECEKELARMIEPVPASVDSAVETGGMTVIRLPGIEPRFLILGPEEVMEKTWTRLAASAVPAGADAWTLLDVLAGVPAVYPETVEEFIPQAVNLDHLDGVSFKKGCYTGQEIVARVHYRGTVKRRMYLAQCDSAEPIRPGEAIHARDGEETMVGQVVSVAPGPETGQLLLTSLMTERAGSELHIRETKGPRIELRDLPYLRAGAS